MSSMVTTAAIASTIARARDAALPGRGAVEVNAVQWSAWRLMRERRPCRRHGRRVTMMRLPVRR
jgi:uncharacterized membrane protein